MHENPLNRRRQMRLKHYDYRQAGHYFVTICTHDRKPFFGDIKNGKMQLNLIGTMIADILAELGGKYPDCHISDQIIMPNHIHFIWVNHQGNTDLSAAIKWFKGKTASLYLKQTKHQNSDGKLWQRGFYDHVIRNEATRLKIAEYIQNNPMQWELDSLNPINQGNG